LNDSDDNEPVLSPFDSLEEEEESQDYLVQVGELETEVVEDALEIIESPQEILQQRIDAARNEHKRHATDTGSPEYQVAGLTERISYLTNHLKTHPKDFSTRRGLVALVNKRRRLLNYLSREDVARYKTLVSSLGIRHKAPGAVPGRAETYARFPKQKAVKKHLVKK